MTAPTALAPSRDVDALAAAIEQVAVHGDLNGLTAPQRVAYYRQVCETVGLNPYTRPFDYLKLNGRMVLYALKAATDQIRRLYGVSIVSVERETVNDLCVVTAIARLPDGRTDSDIGVVSIKGLAGEALANALMKATTKAKRRVTLSICGLGMLDETEVDSIPNAHRVSVNPETGEIAEAMAYAIPNISSGEQIKLAESEEAKQRFGRLARELDLATPRQVKAALNIDAGHSLDGWAVSIGGWAKALGQLDAFRAQRALNEAQRPDAQEATPAAGDGCHVCGEEMTGFDSQARPVCDQHLLFPLEGQGQ